MRRFLIKAIAGLALLVAVLCIGAYAFFRQSLPTLDGTVTVPGISAPIEIVRDADAIPHIFAATRRDALFGLGYVHAQDRLWQMEFQRRIGYGRLSEIFGRATLSQDRFLRTVGFGRAARAAWNSLPEDAKQQVNSYVAGVNAFLSGHHGRALPPEFTLLRFEPEPWQGADVIAWVKMMAWDLSANYSFELLRHDLVARVGAECMAQLMPPYPADGLSILTEQHLAPSGSGGPGRAGGPGRERTQLIHPTYQTHPTYPTHPTHATSWSASLAPSLSKGEPLVRSLLLDPFTEALGSNSWVVDGTMSATGKPLLANDPHLSTRLPSVWYLAHLSAGDFDVIGATLPGAPAVALGRNRFIAWGATNVAADVEDLYRERIDASGKFAEFRGRQEPLQFTTETIAVKGSAPVRLDVRISRHGPLVSDAINTNNVEVELDRKPQPPPLEPLAFRWTALDPDDTSIVSFLRLNEARNWDEFTSALREFVVPSQNFVYADVAGHIGYYAPGRIPIRARGDGSLPADGWSGDFEWSGWIPFDQLPHVFDPSEHAIVTANHRPAPPEYPYLLGLEWPEPYRAQRITALLFGESDRLPATPKLAGSQTSGGGRPTSGENARGIVTNGNGRHKKLTVDDFAAMQADTLSLHAQTVLPTLLSHARPSSPSDVQAVSMLRQWNGNARGDSAAATIFEAWFLRLAPALAGDELGPLATESYQRRFTFTTRFVLNALAPSAAPQALIWCDDVRTPKQETCDDTVTQALHDAVGQVTHKLGGDLSRWRWDAVHRAVFPHQGLDSIGALRPLVSRSVASAGDWSTIDVGPVDTDRPFEQRSVPGYRQIIDLSPANDSRFLDAVGQSGHPLSPHYDDFLADWRAVRYRKMRMERSDVEAGALGRLHLLPRKH